MAILAVVVFNDLIQCLCLLGQLEPDLLLVGSGELSRDYESILNLVLDAHTGLTRHTAEHAHISQKRCDLLNECFRTAACPNQLTLHADVSVSIKESADDARDELFVRMEDRGANLLLVGARAEGVHKEVLEVFGIEVIVFSWTECTWMISCSTRNVILFSECSQSWLYHGADFANAYHVSMKASICQIHTAYPSKLAVHRKGSRALCHRHDGLRHFRNHLCDGDAHSDFQLGSENGHNARGRALQEGVSQCGSRFASRASNDLNQATIRGVTADFTDAFPGGLLIFTYTDDVVILFQRENHTVFPMMDEFFLVFLQNGIADFSDGPVIFQPVVTL